MPAQDIGPTWGDWADAAFVAEFNTKSSVISRTDSHLRLRHVSPGRRATAVRQHERAAIGGGQGAIALGHGLRGRAAKLHLGVADDVAGGHAVEVGVRLDDLRTKDRGSGCVWIGTQERGSAL